MPNSSKDNAIIALLGKTGLFGFISKLEFHNAVILAYDQDEDIRLKGVLDRIKTPYLDADLMVVYETDGSLILLWKDKVPELFSEGKSIAATFPNDPFPHENIDHWYITTSIIAKSIEEEYISERLKQYGISLN